MYGKILSFLMYLVGFVILMGVAYLVGVTPGSPDYEIFQKNTAEVIVAGLIASVMIIGGVWGVQYRHHC